MNLKEAKRKNKTGKTDERNGGEREFGRREREGEEPTQKLEKIPNKGVEKVGPK